MSNDEYLRAVLRAQEVRPGSAEMEELEAARVAIEKLIRAKFHDCSPTIRYGGSKAKGTMNLDDYDLDIICYFANDDTGAGETIKEVYENVKKVLEERYQVNPRTTALRVLDAKRDLHVDVVPGRFIDDKKEDAFVHQNGGSKAYLKTNLDKHVEQVRGSGCTEEIRLMKLWRSHTGVQVRTFPLELLVIAILKSSSASGLDARLKRVLTELRDNIDGVKIEDPANPTGNDMGDTLDAGTRKGLAAAARSTLATVLASGWAAILGSGATVSEPAKSAALSVSVGRTASAPRPWASKE